MQTFMTAFRSSSLGLRLHRSQRVTEMRGRRGIRGRPQIWPYFCRLISFGLPLPAFGRALFGKPPVFARCDQTEPAAINRFQKYQLQLRRFGYWRRQRGSNRLEAPTKRGLWPKLPSICRSADPVGGTSKRSGQALAVETTLPPWLRTSACVSPHIFACTSALTGRRRGFSEFPAASMDSGRGLRVQQALAVHGTLRRIR
jgi:hypothetical protein